jgi:amidohydrolase
LTDTISAATDELTAVKDRAEAEMSRRRKQLIELSHTIHANPELSWEEHAAAALVANTLREAGFQVQVGAYGVPTALEASYGQGDLTVAVCAEYDALPGIGHACGHNVIAAAGVGAVLALAPVAEQAGLRIKLLGTPAEEHGGGKIAMLTEGAWEDVDFSLMVHGMTGGDRPAADMRMTAVERFEVVFTGRTAHAAGAPEQGINAGAAATLAITAMAMLRQHISKDANINAFISQGGEATNVIPDRTVVQVEVRALEIDVWRDLKKRVLACFEGAAIATGCTWSWSQTEHPYAPVASDPTLSALWDDNLTARGRTFSGSALHGGSTDMGNVSQVVPAIHPSIAFIGETAVPHNPAFTAAAAGPAADDAIIDGALALAWTTLDVAMNPELRTEFRRRSTARPEGSTRATLAAQ